MIYWSDFCKRIGIGALHLDVERLCGIYCLGYRYVPSGGDQTQTKWGEREQLDERKSEHRHDEA